MPESVIFPFSKLRLENYSVLSTEKADGWFETYRTWRGRPQTDTARSALPRFPPASHDHHMYTQAPNGVWAASHFHVLLITISVLLEQFGTPLSG